MSVKTAGIIVAGNGLFTLLLMLLGASGLGSFFALFQLGGLVGMPLATVLMHHEIRSWAVTAVLAVALSISLSGLAVQSLIWFNIATAEMTLLTTTLYGLALAWLLYSADFGRSDFGDAV